MVPSITGETTMNARNELNNGFWDGDEKTGKNECNTAHRIAPKLSDDEALKRMPQWLRNARSEAKNTPSHDNEYWG